MDRIISRIAPNHITKPALMPIEDVTVQVGALLHVPTADEIRILVVVTNQGPDSIVVLMDVHKS